MLKSFGKVPSVPSKVLPTLPCSRISIPPSKEEVVSQNLRHHLFWLANYDIDETPLDHNDLAHRHSFNEGYDFLCL